MKKQVVVSMAVAVSMMFLAGPAEAKPTQGTVALQGSIDGSSVLSLGSRSFFAREHAEVILKGDGATKLHLQVFDEAGKLVAEDECQQGACAATWQPKVTGEFRVVVENLGSTYNGYQVIMD